MRVLVTGAGGQLGQTIQQHTEDVVDMSFVFKNSSDLDISDTSSIEAVFISEGPFDFIINCAAYTNVEAAESHQDDAYAINAEAVKQIALLCLKNKTKLIHISTDYVFNGKKSQAYLETDATEPINVYGASKLKGEKYIQQLMSEYYIIRTSWLYSKQFGKNFYKFIEQGLKDQRELPIIDNQFGSPTNTLFLTQAIIEIIRSKNEAFGLYHYGLKGTTNWHTFALEIAKNVAPEKQHLIKAVKEFKTKAKRPAFSKLDTHKIEKTFDLDIPYWTEAIQLED